MWQCLSMKKIFVIVLIGLLCFGCTAVKPEENNVTEAQQFKDAKKFIEDYFKTYPNIKKYLDEQVAFCEDNGYVKTMLNRRRYINEINDRNYMMREFGKRAAMNATIQGSAADLIKIAMVYSYISTARKKDKE